MPAWTSRLLALAWSATLGACSLIGHAPTASLPAWDEPIIFVHGNGDNASLFIATAWRFESNGWPRDRLFAFNLPYPVSRDLNDVAQANRTSAEEYTAFLAAKVDEVKRITGAPKVILIGNSRGGYPIRRYLRDGGAKNVSDVILGGTPNHGVSVSTTVQPTNEYNGAGPWLVSLNAPQGPAEIAEVTPGVRFLTLRSDHNDLYAQPTGAYIGMPNMDTHVTFDGPALAGAQNVVLPGVDHRETVYSVQAFNQMWQFLTGRTPKADIIAEAKPEISGCIFAIERQTPTNLPLAGTHVQIFRVDAASGRREEQLLDTHVSDDGRFGPVALDSKRRYEFALEHPGYSVTHLYFGDFLRSTEWLNLSLQAKVDNATSNSVVTLARPSGYFNTTRDTILLDGLTPKEIQTPVPTKAQATVTIPEIDAMHPVVGRYDDEVIVAPAWPGVDANGSSQRVVEVLLD